MADAVPDRTIQHLAMLARLYVEALLVDCREGYGRLRLNRRKTSAPVLALHINDLQGWFLDHLNLAKSLATVAM